MVIAFHKYETIIWSPYIPQHIRTHILLPIYTYTTTAHTHTTEYIHPSTHPHTFARVHIRTRTYPHTHTSAHAHIRTRTYPHAHISARAHIRTRTHPLALTSARVHMRTRTNNCYAHRYAGQFLCRQPGDAIHHIRLHHGYRLFLDLHSFPSYSGTLFPVSGHSDISSYRVHYI